MLRDELEYVVFYPSEGLPRPTDLLVLKKNQTIVLDHTVVVSYQRDQVNMAITGQE